MGARMLKFLTFARPFVVYVDLLLRPAVTHLGEEFHCVKREPFIVRVDELKPL